MQRCAIERTDGVVRIGVLCARCADTAVARSVERGTRFWSRDYSGSEICEACHEDDTLMTEQR